MIKKNIQNSDIILLWKEAFGDSREEITYFIENVKNAECIGYYIDKQPVSMLYAVECTIDEKPCVYIYAACTSHKYRKRGIMTKLIEFCKQEYSELCLIPANDKLIKYYSELGFDKRIPINKINFIQTFDITEYLLEGYALSEPTALYYGGN